MFSYNNYHLYKKEDSIFYNFLLLLKKQDINSIKIFIEQYPAVVVKYDSFSIGFTTYYDLQTSFKFLYDNYFINNNKILSKCFFESFSVEHLPIFYFLLNNLNEISNLKSGEFQNFYSFNIIKVKEMYKKNIPVNSLFHFALLQKYKNTEEELNFLLSLPEFESFFDFGYQYFFNSEFDYSPVSLNIFFLRAILNSSHFNFNIFQFLIFECFSQGDFNMFKEVILKNFKISENVIGRIMYSNNKQFEDREKIIEYLIHNYDIKEAFKVIDYDFTLIDSKYRQLIDTKYNINNF